MIQVRNPRQMATQQNPPEKHTFKKCSQNSKTRYCPPLPLPKAFLTSQAKALNIPPSEYTLPALSSSLPRTKTFRGGGYRGRPYQERGGRGRGRGGTSSRSLDLRPRSILVPGIIGTEKETAIREWLVVNSGEAVCESLDGDNGKGMVVKFKERYEAEEVCALFFPDVDGFLGCGGVFVRGADLL